MSNETCDFIERCFSDWNVNPGVIHTELDMYGRPDPAFVLGIILDAIEERYQVNIPYRNLFTELAGNIAGAPKSLTLSDVSGLASSGGAIGALAAAANEIMGKIEDATKGVGAIRRIISARSQAKAYRDLIREPSSPLFGIANRKMFLKFTSSAELYDHMPVVIPQVPAWGPFNTPVELPTRVNGTWTSQPVSLPGVSPAPTGRCKSGIKVFGNGNASGVGVNKGSNRCQGKVPVSRMLWPWVAPTISEPFPMPIFVGEIRYGGVSYGGNYDANTECMVDKIGAISSEMFVKTLDIRHVAALRRSIQQFMGSSTVKTWNQDSNGNLAVRTSLGTIEPALRYLDSVMSYRYLVECGTKRAGVQYNLDDLTKLSLTRTTRAEPIPGLGNSVIDPTGSSGSSGGAGMLLLLAAGGAAAYAYSRRK